MDITVITPEVKNILPSPRRILARAGSRPERDMDFEHEVKDALRALSRLARPKGFYANMKIVSQDENRIITRDFIINSNDMARKLKGAEVLSVLMATIGAGPEEECHRLERIKEHTRAFFLDAAASEMTEELLRLVHRQVAEKMPGFRGTARYAPGYGDFSLEHQKSILSLLGGEKTGVKITESFMLLPRKSTTGVVAWIRQNS